MIVCGIGLIVGVENASNQTMCFFRKAQKAVDGNSRQPFAVCMNMMDLIADNFVSRSEDRGVNFD